MFAPPDRAAKSHPLTRLLLLAVMLIASPPARSSDVESEHLFGFTEDADIGKNARPKPRPLPVWANQPAATRR